MKEFPKTEVIQTERGSFGLRDSRATNLKPAVLIHGWPESSYCWHGVAPHLIDHRRLIMPDLRGLGDSNRDPEVSLYSKDQLAKDVIEIIRQLGIDQFDLIGHDWGGAVAQEIALAIPEQINRFVLMNISIINNLKGNLEAQTLLNSQGNRPNWYQHFQATPRLPEAMIPGNEDTWLRYFLRPGVPESAIQEYIRCYSIPGTPASGAAYYRTFPQDIKRWQNLNDHVFDLDTLFIYGNKDPVVIPAFLNYAEHCFKSLKIEPLPAYHFVQEEQADQAGRLIRQFLSN